MAGGNNKTKQKQAKVAKKVSRNALTMSTESEYLRFQQTSINV